MKLILSLLFIIACSKTSHQEVPDHKIREKTVTGYRTELSQYNPVVDVMVAFLWPEVVTTENQRKAIRDVIHHSRELRQRKDEYQLKKLQLRKKYDAHSCDCALNSECTGEETNLDQNLCYELEESLYAHDRTLPDIMKLVDIIKANVKECGGEWLETHTDFVDEPASRIDLSSKKFYLGSLGHYFVGEDKKPMVYQVEDFTLTEESDFLRLQFSMPRFLTPSQTKGYWLIDVSLQPSRGALLFQGELKWIDQGKERLGVIYWENPRQ